MGQHQLDPGADQLLLPVSRAGRPEARPHADQEPSPGRGRAPQDPSKASDLCSGSGPAAGRRFRLAAACSGRTETGRLQGERAAAAIARLIATTRG